MMHPVRTGRRVRAGLLVAIVCALSVAPAVLGVAETSPGQRVDLKVLLLSAAGNDSQFGAWKAVLDRQGLVYDAKIAASDAPYTDATFADYGANRARYSAVILTDGDLLHNVGGQFVSALSQPEWDALAKFETTFGIRQISDATVPSAAHGLNLYTQVGSQDGIVGQLTPEGRSVFPELVGPVPIPNASPSVAETFGYQATPLDGASFTTLVAGPNGSSYVGRFTHPDGREEMVLTVTSNEFQTHNQLLRRGLVDWVTRGVHLGSTRNYFSMHIDDVFLPDAKWDPVSHTTPGDLNPPTCGGAGQPPCIEVRMTPTDVAAVDAFQNEHGFTFDFAYNGVGVEEARDANGGVDPLSDDATWGLLRPGVIAKFRWINHTWSHLQLDNVSLAQLNAEFAQNIAFASANQIPINVTELVTGEHSGLGSYTAIGGNPMNPNMPAALAANGVSWVGDDNSVRPAQRSIGVAKTVPRYPSNVYFNVASRADQLDEYNWIYTLPPVGGCVNTAVTTCNAAPVSWETYLRNESSIMFDHLMGNDPRPHYAHQANLIVDGGGNGILFGADDAGVLDRLFGQYAQLFDTAKAPLVNPSMATAGELLARQSQWAAAKAGVTAYLQDGVVHVQTSAPTAVPLTGTTVGDPYAGTRSGWTVVNGAGVFTPADPVAAAPPSITGAPYVGQTLTAVAGAWTGSSPVTTSRRWLRCDAAGAACTVITSAGLPVTGPTYVLQAADLGSRIRVVELATNPVSAVAHARSAPTTAVANPPVAPTNQTAPKVTGTPQVGQVLAAVDGTWLGTPPVTVTRSWSRCDESGANCQVVGGPGGTYTLTSADVGGRLKVVEQASNAASSASAESELTSAVVAAPGSGPTPPVVTPPTITAQARVSGFRVSRGRFVAARTPSDVSRPRVGTALTWELSQASPVRLVVQRRSGKRWTTVRSWVRPGVAGRNSWTYLGWANGRRMAPGTGRFAIWIEGANGVRVDQAIVPFTLLAR